MDCWNLHTNVADPSKYLSALEQRARKHVSLQDSVEIFRREAGRRSDSNMHAAQRTVMFNSSAVVRSEMAIVKAYLSKGTSFGLNIKTSRLYDPSAPMMMIATADKPCPSNGFRSSAVSDFLVPSRTVIIDPKR